MASLSSNSACSLANSLATIPRAAHAASSPAPKIFACTGGRQFRGLKYIPRTQIFKGINRSCSSANGKSRRFQISCSAAQPETLEIVRATISKQLSIDESTVTPETKFVDLGADSLDTVEIMMALEEQFKVSIGEGGAENIITVQDAADLVQKVKAGAT